MPTLKRITLILAAVCAFPLFAEVEPNDQPYLANIVDSTGVSGRLDTVDDIDYYNVLVIDTTAMFIDLSLDPSIPRVSNSSDWKVTVYSPTGELVDSFTTKLLEPFVKGFRTDTDGEYLIKIEIGEGFYSDTTYYLDVENTGELEERTDALVDFTGIWKLDDSDPRADFISIHQNRDTAVFIALSMDSGESSWETYYGNVNQDTVYTSLLLGTNDVEFQVTLVQPDTAEAEVISCFPVTSAPCSYTPGEVITLKRVFKPQPYIPAQ